RGPRLVGVLPLYGSTPGGPVFGTQQLGFLSTGETEYEETCPDYLDLLCLPGEETACLESVWETLQAMRWDRLNLLNIPEHSPLLKWTDSSWGNDRVEAVPTGICPIANLEQGFEAYITFTVSVRSSVQTAVAASGCVASSDRTGPPRCAS